MNRPDAKKIAQYITNEQLQKMFDNAKVGIKDWTKVSIVNKGLTKGVAWNILAKVTKSADKTSSSIMDKILDNKSQANKSKEVQDKILTKSSPLSEEISKMKYLIEYMNNNKKQIL